MKQLRLNVGDRVYVKGRMDEGLWEIYDEEFDREGNACYHIHQEDETGSSDESGLYAEELIPEDDCGPETCADVQREDKIRELLHEIVDNYDEETIAHDNALEILNLI